MHQVYGVKNWIAHFPAYLQYFFFPFLPRKPSLKLNVLLKNPGGLKVLFYKFWHNTLFVKQRTCQQVLRFFSKMRFVLTKTTQARRKRGARGALAPPLQFLADQFTYLDQGTQIIPTHYYQPPSRIFRPCDGPATNYQKYLL